MKKEKKTKQKGIGPDGMKSSSMTKGERRQRHRRVGLPTLSALLCTYDDPTFFVIFDIFINFERKKGLLTFPPPPRREIVRAKNKNFNGQENNETTSEKRKRENPIVRDSTGAINIYGMKYERVKYVN